MHGASGTRCMRCMVHGAWCMVHPGSVLSIYADVRSVLMTLLHSKAGGLFDANPPFSNELIHWAEKEGQRAVCVYDRPRPMLDACRTMRLHIME